MKCLHQKPAYVDVLWTVAGTGCMAFGIQWFFDPAGLVTGGFTGIAIIVRQMTLGVFPGGLPLWLTNIALNIPLFWAAYFVFGKRFVGRTILGASLLSAWLYVIPAGDMAQGDPLLAAVFGGLACGVGIGLVLLAKSTTGGTDLASVLIQAKRKHYSVMQIMQVIDGLVVICGLYAFGLHSGLYAVIAIFITAKVSDALMEGMHYSKAAFIITDQYGQMAQMLMEKLNRGLTALYAKGMYSGSDKQALYCVVSKKEIVELKEIVAQLDENAFVIVSDVREVLGEGFRKR